MDAQRPTQLFGESAQQPLQSVEGALCSSAQARLLLWTDSGAHSFLMAKGESVVLGRSPDADVRVDSSSVSRWHARLAFDGDL